MPDITGVDFVALQVADHARAAKFYGETLGLPFVKSWGKMPASEFQAGNLTLAVGAKYYLNDQRFLWGDFAAAAVLSGLPITLVFLLAQRWIVSGLTAGGVKG